MTNLKPYREYIILIAIAAILLLYIIFRSAGNINYELPVFVSVDSSRINRITIEGPETDLEFQRDGDKWLIQPESWIADSSRLNIIVDNLSELKIADLISSSGSLSLYKLDEKNRVTITAYDGEDILRELYLGKVSNSGIYTYVMFPGNNNIYSLRGDLPSRFSGDKNSLREQRILEIPRDGVLKISLTSDGSTTTMFQDGTNTWITDGGFEPDGTAVKRALSVLDPLRCTAFTNAPPAGEQEWELEIMLADETVTLEIWPETQNGYPVVSSQNGYHAIITSSSVETILKAFGYEFE